jgi:hypothetical protein
VICHDVESVWDSPDYTTILIGSPEDPDCRISADIPRGGVSIASAEIDPLLHTVLVPQALLGLPFESGGIVMATFHLIQQGLLRP